MARAYAHRVRRSPAFGALLLILSIVSVEPVEAQTCGQFVDVITAPSNKTGNHACDSDHDGTIKDSNYCYCDDCSIQPERCHGRGDIAFCSCDPAIQHCRPRTCVANGSCSASDPHSYFWALDCNDYNRDRFPGNCEICGDTVDDNCDGSTTDCTSTDADGDGFSPPQDCNDNNPQAHPGATEIPCNSVDEDCSGSDLCDNNPTDPDGDGYVAPADCNENDAAIHPGAVDICGDGIDSDCIPGDCLEDADGDGSQTPADCNDANPAIHPGAFDLCGDGIDQDCSGADRACVMDMDRDGYDALSAGGTDCNDLDSSIHPGAIEVCGDGVDQDCNGSDADCAEFDRDGDGHTDVAAGGDDCDDTDDSVYPGAPEGCGKGTDANCDHIPDMACADSPTDLDGDGFQSTKYGGEDCNDRDSRINPLALEVCGDHVDNDCNGVADELCAPLVTPPEDILSFVNETGRAACTCTTAASSSGLLPLLGLLLAWAARRRWR